MSVLERILEILPEECWITRSADVKCDRLVGGALPNGVPWIREMCCLPCQIRMIAAEEVNHA